MFEGYGIYKNNIYGANGQLIGKYTENTVFTKFGAWEMHKVNNSYYLRAIGATILGVPIGQNIQGNLLTIGTNAFLTIEGNLIRCYDFAGNLVYAFTAIGTVRKPPLILNNTLITSNAAYNLADGTQIPGHPGILDRQIVHEGKLYRWSTGVDENNIRYYEINHISTGTGNIIKTVRTTDSLQREWAGNINLGYYDAVNPTGRYIAQIVDFDTGACIGRTLIGPITSDVFSHVLGNEIYVEIRRYFTSGVPVEWYRLEYDAEEDQFKLRAAKKQKHFDKQYITHYETFTAHIEEEPENPFSGITPNQVFIKSEELEGQENTSYYTYPLSENIVFTKENLNVTEILIDSKSVNYSIDGDKVMVQADDINAALEEEEPVFYEYGNRLIEKKNITILFETDKGQKTAMVTQERVISGNIEQDVEEGNIIYDPERDEPLYPDDPDYEEEKPQYPPVPGEEPLEFGDDGYPYSEDRGPIWSNHPDHPAFGIEEINIIPSEAEIFPNQETEFEIEIAYKEGIAPSKAPEEILNIRKYPEDCLEVSISQNIIKVTGMQVTDNAFVEISAKGGFSGDRKAKLTARADIKVVSPIESIAITPEQAEILHEQSQNFTVEINWKEGAQQQDISEHLEFTWPKALEAQVNGSEITVIGTRPIHNAKITVKLQHELYGELTATATLTVNQLIQSIQLTPRNATLVKGERQEFEVNITWVEGAQEKSLEEICTITADSALRIDKIEGNTIEVIAQKLALNAKLKVTVKSEYLLSTFITSTAYVKITSFEDKIPNYPPLSAVRLRFKAGNSTYELGNYLIDRFSFRIKDTTAQLECRNRTGHYLKDQHVGDNRNFIGPGSEVLENILEAAGVQAYVVQQGFTEEIHLELDPKSTFLDAIGEVLEHKPDWVIQQHRHDGVYPGNREAILIGDTNFMANNNIYKGAYIFYRDRDIFSREVIKSVDDVYGRVCVHTPDYELEFYSLVDNNLAIHSLKTFFYEVPENTSEQQAQNILNRLKLMLKTAGKIETFVTAFRPHIEPGDIALIKNENGDEEEVGIITSVTHNFGRRGFVSEFTIDSSGLVEKESLLKMTMKRMRQEPNLRISNNRLKLTSLT